MKFKAAIFVAATCSVVVGSACADRLERSPRTASFDARHELKVFVPGGAQRVRVWFAMPQDDPFQVVRGFKVQSPTPYRITTDSENNRMVYVELLKPAQKEVTVIQTFSLRRREQLSKAHAAKARNITEDDRRKYAAYLAPNQNVTITDAVRALAKEIVGGEENPVRAARKLYDWMLANIDHWVKDPKHKAASPVGSTDYCLQTKTGNCTDLHSLFTSLARASGIPTRMVYGSFFKTELDGHDVDQGYHCWPEFYAPNIGWVPHDVAVADIFASDFKIIPENEKLVRLLTADGYRGPDKSMIEYYFGNVDERRVTFSRGRDLTLSPKQDGGPVNALVKAYVEVDGNVHPEKTGWVRKLTFTEDK